MNTANDLFFEWNDCIFGLTRLPKDFSVILAFDVCGPLVRMANIFLLGVKISRYDDGFLALFILSPRENQ